MELSAKQFGSLGGFLVVKVSEQVSFVFFSYLVNIVLKITWYNVEMYVVDFESALLKEWSIVLADVAAITQFADNFFLNEKD